MAMHAWYSSKFLLVHFLVKKLFSMVSYLNHGIFLTVFRNKLCDVSKMRLVRKLGTWNVLNLFSVFSNIFETNGSY